ncbi:MAG: hypothetical protein EPN39_06715 [Chitinophagaceae bacterium]|nr:MAG: hypothetical protein EPN39_06715 [Chitinophagaceae bacterium]
MSSITITRLYDLLSAKIGKETAESLTNYIEDKVKEEIDNQTLILATKDDMVSLKSEIARLDIKIADSKSDVIKWMFIFWVGQVAATFGFILLFLKK